MTEKTHEGNIERISPDGLAKALVLHDDDDVAIMVADGSAGQTCAIQSSDGTTLDLLLINDVPLGHKLAIRHITSGETVTKYGQPIGVATQEIAPGMHIHTHNLGGYRAGLRGKL